ncbi:hypothetical protein ABB37_05858 [Leptomonas pyrrhocoris]|uniref:Uncharacterized protein n=1 Tax=Leptomonas pyrrhocoris TaxID=157538 RepID=A0A0M9FYY2_LEPPY|nr:hypothetical protein ABB37_05858 [Leptomonas pyrrhocoris]KPA78736.1 hypothetical protein ABB37_05858 [Leptomonas pyrrhocoris]|eukprot:XP_015657175.1 hypothetical protein ABB37_05858 [Leptomonas pyrrhocoris]
MSTLSPDGVAFSIFVSNKRRYVVPVNAQGEQLGPPLPFRNANRRKRKGYGPGSSNTSLTEETSSPSTSPLADAAASLEAISASLSSDSSHSSPSRSGRLHLSRSVSFLDKSTAGPTYTEPIDSRANKEGAPPSILQKKSSFRITLRPLFDFEYEPPHQPRDDKKAEAGAKTKVEAATEEDAVVTTIPLHVPESGPHLPSLSPPISVPEDWERPRSPPSPLAPHRKSDPGMRFVRGSNVAAAAMPARAPPPASAYEITKPIPETFSFLTTTWRAEEAAGELTKPAPPVPKPQEYAPSPSKDAVVLACTTMSSPPPDYLSRLMPQSSLPRALKSETKAAAPVSLTPEPQTSVKRVAPTATATHAPRHRYYRHSTRHHTVKEKDAPPSQSATAAASEPKTTQRKEDVNMQGADREEEEKVEGRQREDNAISPAEQKNTLVNVFPSQKPEVYEFDSPASHSSNFHFPSTAKVAAAAKSNEAYSTISPSNSAGRHSASPRLGGSPDLGETQLNSAFGIYEEVSVSPTKAIVSPSAQSNEDHSVAYRYRSPKLLTPKMAVFPARKTLPTTTAAPDAHGGEEYRCAYQSPPLDAVTPTLPPPPPPPSATPTPRHHDYEIRDPYTAEDAVSRSSLLDTTLPPKAKRLPRRIPERKPSSDSFVLPLLLSIPSLVSLVRRGTPPRSVSLASSRNNNSASPAGSSLLRTSSPADSSCSYEYGSMPTLSDTLSGYEGVESISVESHTGSNSKTSTMYSSGSKRRQSSSRSLWSKMVRRLRMPLISKSSDEEVTPMQQLNRYRSRRALANSRGYGELRVEEVWSGESSLSSVETEGPADPLRRHRRAKKSNIS